MANHEYIYESRTEDLDTELQIDGVLPPSLEGIFYGIGGSGCRVGSSDLHLLDAHGRVTAVSIAKGKASLRARMVKTPLWEAERSADAIVKRRFFRNKPKRWSNLFDVDLGNPAGHNVIRWGKDLVATNDPGFFLLDPVTLETRGPAPLAPAKGATFTPMPRRDPKTGHHVVFEMRPGLRDTIIVREIDDAFSVVKEQTYKLPRGACFLHDVTLSENYYVVIQWASVSLPTFLWGAALVADAVNFDPASTPMLYLLPRAGGAPIAVPLPARTHFHFWNAFEKDGKVAVDAIGYEGQVDFKSAMPPTARDAGSPAAAATPPSATWRYTIDPKTRDLNAAKLTETPAEIPEIHPDRRGRSYRYGWACAPGKPGDEKDRGNVIWYHGIARHDFDDRSTQVWDAGTDSYVSGPAFVQRKGGTAEDDGHVLSFVQDIAKKRTTIAVLDAKDIAAGPVARLSCAALLGPISHVSFSAS